MAGPLEGIRILDLTRVMAGPWCTQILADMGAEVIKVERPGIGDDTRHWGPPWMKDKEGKETRESAYYLSANRGKRSITVNIGDPTGRDIVRQLAAKVDILVENFKTGDLARKGLGFADLCKENPELIYCSVTGFGQTGPMADLPGYDYLIQAQGGLMSITGVPDGKPGASPQRVGMAVSDLTTGMSAVIALLGALRHRDRTGKGQHIDLALLDVQVSWLANQAQSYFCSGEVPRRTGTYHPNLAPYQPFQTKDGNLIIAVGNDIQFQRLCTALGTKELIADSRFASNPARCENREALIAKLERVTLTKSSHEWTRILQEAQVPCGPIQTIDQVFEDPQVQARDMIVNLEHPVAGAIPTVANPIKYSLTPLEYQQPPPLLGEHTKCVLGDYLGMDETELAKLEKSGVI
jgi:crotonobetainyl-CoA:carnitine CoA-transferase CaiB-like acyl-CoA transferase